MDIVSKRRRSEIMSRIRSHNTGPEHVVRRFLHQEGLRFRLHGPELSGKPDLVFPSRRTCVFVHGCFWHGCPRCIDGTRKVKTNAAYWNDKIVRNKARDIRTASALRRAGWHVFTIWECQTARPSSLRRLANKLKATA